MVKIKFTFCKTKNVLGRLVGSIWHLQKKLIKIGKMFFFQHSWKLYFFTVCKFSLQTYADVVKYKIFNNKPFEN